MSRVHSAITVCWSVAVLLAAMPIAATTIPASAIPSGGLSLVNVFSFGEGGYFCIKIPYLFTTKDGSLLAFAEARYVTCDDWAATDLVTKRSTDNGTTWSPLAVVYGNSSLADNISNVIGNAAPLQLRVNGRVLLPFCRNNNETWQTHSDDDGVTWAPPAPVPGGTRPGWAWIGLGPPGGMQLLSGRLAVASYHSYIPGTDGTITRSHLMLSDDPYGHPLSWRIGAVAPGIEWSNECQVTELAPNHLLIAARGFLWSRMQIESFDGGESLQEPYYIAITEPIDGCEGSILHHRQAGLLFYSGTVNINPERFNMTIWQSADGGKSWQLGLVVDTGRTAYSSLVLMPDGRSVGLLYERTNFTDFVFLPEHLTFTVVWPYPATNAVTAK